MNSDFWHNRWQKNEIAFHTSEANPLLVNYFNRLALEKGSRVFVPLCGKTLDIHWLLSQGYRVAGAELSPIAIGQLFQELKLEPKIETAGELKHYSAKNIDIFGGDLFHLTEKTLGKIDAVYDRAALVALPEKIRDRYTVHLRELTKSAPQLLICYQYNQSLMDGPPFSISDEEVHRHYESRYDLNRLNSIEVPALRGKAPAKENVWLLKKK